jgi:hypothetical protein
MSKWALCISCEGWLSNKEIDGPCPYCGDTGTKLASNADKILLMFYQSGYHTTMEFPEFLKKLGI